MFRAPPSVGGPRSPGQQLLLIIHLPGDSPLRGGDLGGAGPLIDWCLPNNPPIKSGDYSEEVRG